MAIWMQIRDLAARTPEERNRYVDFLRAISILVVITGHWLIATSWYVDGQLSSGQLLKSHPDSQWLTWVFQVMPIFFIVGGYSNAVSLESARRNGINYGGWLVTRLNRLVAPLLVLIVTWAVIGAVMGFAGVDEGVIQFASQASLIPTWFLAIYIMVVILAPLTFRFWQ
ncbi:MAG: acyltransferase, partial [Gammaproteobacteria bacterium]|nr:acyltransferase [Gammaproteobacteria bacterium]